MTINIAFIGSEDHATVDETAAYALAWLGIVSVGWSPLVTLEPVSWLQSPVSW